MSRVRKDRSTPENRAFWDAVAEAAKTVATWPAWKQGDAQTPDYYDIRYGPPNAGMLRYAAAQALYRLADVASNAGHAARNTLLVVARRLARPRCVYPECRCDVGSWTVDGYVPIDTWLCDAHHAAYTATWREFTAGSCSRDARLHIAQRGRRPCPRAGARRDAGGRHAQESPDEAAVATWAAWHLRTHGRRVPASGARPVASGFGDG